MDEKVIQFGMVTQLIASEIAHSGIANIDVDNVINKSKEICQKVIKAFV